MSKPIEKPIVPHLPLIKYLPSDHRAQCGGLFGLLDQQLLKYIFKYIPTEDLASLAVTCKYLQQLTQPELEIHKKGVEIILKREGFKFVLTIPKQVISKVRGKPLRRSPFQLAKGTSSLFNFPFELNKLIFSYLSYEDLMRALPASRGFQAQALAQVLENLEKKETFTFNELQELKSLIRCANQDEKVKQAILACVKVVNLSGCDLDDAALQKLNLSQYVNLKAVNLSGSAKITDKGLQFLPQQITELSLFGCVKITNKGIKSLPKGLQSINLRQCPLITDQGFADLPKTLESLCAGKITQEELKLVPGLKKLDAIIVSLDNKIEFPSTLEELSLSQSVMTPEIMAKLPPGLKKLSLELCGDMQGEFPFPKSLTHLTLFFSGGDDATLQKLPESLEDLSLEGSFVTEAALSYLPKGLKRLHISSLNSITLEGMQKLHSFTQLTRLSMPYVNNLALKDFSPQLEESALEVVEEKEKDLKDLSLKLPLPPQLEELSLGSVKDEREDLKYLPPTLKKLSLLYRGDGGLEHLPQGIESLELDRGSIITDKDLAALPNNLRSLKFCPLPENSLKVALPSGLTDLAMTGSPHGGQWESVSVLNRLRRKKNRKTNFIPSSTFQMNWLENLSPGIKKLKLSFFSGITLKSLEHLPENIEKLELRVCDISEENMKNFLKDLPKKLKKLNWINDHQVLKERKS